MATKKKKFPLGWIWAVVLAGGGGGGYYWYHQNSARQAAELPKGVQTARSVKGDLEQKITATGVVAAQVGAKINIGSQITGRIKSLPADVGTKVSQGQVVAVLDAPDLQAQVDQQRDNVAAARSGMEQAQSRLRQAELNLSLSKEQTQAQIQEADFGARAAGEQLKNAEAAARLQPTQTSTDIAKAQAALSTAKSQQKQVQQTVNLQLLQAQTSVDDSKLSVTNAQRQRKRQEGLLAEGFVSQQDVDDIRTTHRQAVAHLQNAEANLRIVKEKTAADLQNAEDQVTQAQAVLEAARAGRLNDEMRAAAERNAREAYRQSQATLQLRQANKTQDVVRKRAVEEAQGAVRQAQASLKQSQALLQYQEANLDKAIIRSPIAGTVLSITTQQGETVAAGFQTQTLITVADLNRLEVRGYVDEVDVGRVHVGLPAEVRVEAFPNRVFHGRVTKIASASTLKDNVVTYETTVKIDDSGGLLRPDMTADVTLILGRTADVLLVPTEAVHREVSRTILYVLHREKTGADRVETRVIHTGVSDGTHTQIVSGLNPGEEVVLAGLQRLGVNASDSQTAKGKKE